MNIVSDCYVLLMMQEQRSPLTLPSRRHVIGVPSGSLVFNENFIFTISKFKILFWMECWNVFNHYFCSTDPQRTVNLLQAAFYRSSMSLHTSEDTAILSLNEALVLYVAAHKHIVHLLFVRYSDNHWANKQNRKDPCPCKVYGDGRTIR